MKILVIAPHMDDEVLGLGGTIARYVEQKYHVTVCFVANRAYGHQYLDKLIDEEKRSALKAKNILGYQEAVFLGLPDEGLDARLIDVIVPLEEVLWKVRPDIVFLNHGADNNQDHRAVFQAGMVACRVISKFKVKKILCYEVPSSTDQVAPLQENSFLPNYYVNVDRYLRKKQKSLSCYGRELKEFPHPRSKKGVEIYARKRGMEIGFSAAEAFMVMRSEWE